jgi:nucleoside-diphosphate-sugar epimerase
LEEALQNLLNHAKSKSKIKKIPHWLAIPTLYILDKLGFSPLGPWHYLTYHKDYYFDIEDTKRILNWQPKFDNDSTLSMAYDWYLKNKNYLSNDK